MERLVVRGKRSGTSFSSIFNCFNIYAGLDGFSFDRSFARSTINPLTAYFSSITAAITAALGSRKSVGRLLAGRLVDVVVDAPLI